MRAGIVASLFWLPLGSLYLAKQKEARNERLVTESYDRCRQVALAGRSHLEDCDLLIPKRWPSYHEDILKMAFGEALVRLAIAWILGVLLYWGVRWVLAGRINKPAADNPR